MKAARWTGLGRVECEDVPVPPVADGELLVRTVYASICGSDPYEVFFETPPPARPGGPGPDARPYDGSLTEGSGRPDLPLVAG